MESYQCSFITELELVPGLESNTEPETTIESMVAPNSSTKSEYQSSYEPTGEPKSTTESDSAVELESRVDGWDHYRRTANRGC